MPGQAENIPFDFRKLLPDSQRATALHACRFIIKNPACFHDLFALALADEPAFSMRAARVVQMVADNLPELIVPRLKQIIDSLLVLQEVGAIRSILKLLINKTGFLDETETGRLTHLCFRWLETPGKPVAIRVYSMYILYAISDQIPEIKLELDTVVRYIIEEDTPAIKAAGNKVLAKLQREISPS